MRLFRKGPLTIVGMTMIALAALKTVLAQPVATHPAAPRSVVDRGKYLVTVQDCNGCHTPFNEKGEPDMSRMLSGHPESLKISAPPKLGDGWATAINATNTAWAGPWGVSFTTNLTPDPQTGIGAWSERLFIDAIRKGKKLGVGRELLPPMPWRMYAQLTDDDLKAMYAYLMTLKPIQNQVPNAIPLADR